MSTAYGAEDQPLLARESLFRLKLNQLRSTGEIQRNNVNSSQAALKQIEQNEYLNNIYNSFQHTDPRQLETVALLDSLTELYNHNTACRILKDELKRAARYQGALSLLVVTIDHLSRLSDIAGAFAFDSTLKYVARYLMRSVRDIDIAGRYDLEHFMVICPQTDFHGAFCLAQRLCNNFQRKNHTVLGNRSITISLGIATFPDSGHSDEQLIKSSMQSLSLVKQSGGNNYQ